MHIFCDFDGTITTRDSTDFVMERLAAPGWLQIEEQWQRGEIGSAECMRRQVALIRATKQELDQTLDEVQIDDGFSDFAAFCEASGTGMTIISDGVDYFIHHILGRHGLDKFPIIANRLTITPEHVYQLASPWRSATCVSSAGVCKCSIVGKEQAHRMYVGDSRSDFCVASKPEMVFAKGKLADYCDKNDIPYAPYNNFHNVTDGLARLLQDVPVHMKAI
ncbi:MAG: MtnX-like HAD-IB family phosphatase [Proteobacteria bacterium]|nr:MtnX-like HAD-IB family phosphatase [Pseudomonadota bacterium]